ncbi:fumarylacetoacetate hydrolase family protein [Rhizobium sp. ICMP 5592]|uniref:2-keto-4-pentenoate hydratase n=1 Tax=Rhizobium sp. ICMP 5592 TaxID=2292445 RepID=UPI001295B466|nr:fumarylacetoacetate hydrolase family protein [Rhizobium sp. ICMP 5592]MQB46104.1 2-keto-4-pentenoate hydratase [Rhizobium sp. ICMP 5592]
MSGRITEAADALFAARRALVQVPRVSETFGIATATDAYAIQQANADRHMLDGRKIVGRKIGLTSKAVQQQLGVDQPDYGVLWADYAFSDGETVPSSKFIQAKAEAEIAFVIGRSLDDPSVNMTALIGAIEYALPSAEIVDSAIANWSITLVDTIADNASAGGFCLGSSPRKLEGLDLRLGGAVLSKNGGIASVGVGAACLGHPLNATLWLARKMAELGTPLKEGDIVLSGALGPMVPAEAGDVFTVEIQGFSTLNFAFSR